MDTIIILSIYNEEMGALNKNPLFNINKKSIRIAPFWKFYLNDLVIQLRKEMAMVFGKNVQVELIDSKVVSYESADFELGEDFNQLIWCDTKSCPLYLHIPNQSANKLVNQLLGSKNTEYVEKRFLTKLDSKCLEKFSQSIVTQMNKVMTDKGQNFSFELRKEFINKSFYGFVLFFQVDMIPVNIYIPEGLFKLNIVK